MESLREDFTKHLASALKDTGRAALHLAWQSQGARALLYEELLKRVVVPLAEAFGEVELERELLRVDFALVGRSDRVPRIFVESENEAWTAVQEVRKLCCLAARLKVLISVVEWDETPGVWHGKGQLGQLLGAWREVVTKHQAAGEFRGEIVAIVGEWRPNGVLRFQCARLDTADSPDAFMCDIP